MGRWDKAVWLGMELGAWDIYGTREIGSRLLSHSYSYGIQACLGLSLGIIGSKFSGVSKLNRDACVSIGGSLVGCKGGGMF